MMFQCIIRLFTFLNIKELIGLNLCVSRDFFLFLFSIRQLVWIWILHSDKLWVYRVCGECWRCQRTFSAVMGTTTSIKYCTLHKCKVNEYLNSNITAKYITCLLDEINIQKTPILVQFYMLNWVFFSFEHQVQVLSKNSSRSSRGKNNAVAPKLQLFSCESHEQKKRNSHLNFPSILIQLFSPCFAKEWKRK